MANPTITNINNIKLNNNKNNTNQQKQQQKQHQHHQQQTTTTTNNNNNKPNTQINPLIHPHQIRSSTISIHKSGQPSSNRNTPKQISIGSSNSLTSNLTVGILYKKKGERGVGEERRGEGRRGVMSFCQTRQNNTTTKQNNKTTKQPPSPPHPPTPPQTKKQTAEGPEKRPLKLLSTNPAPAPIIPYFKYILPW